MYTVVVPVNIDQVVVRPDHVKCVRIDKRVDYELRVYKSVRPFDLDLFQIDPNGETNKHIKTLSGRKKNEHQ